MADEIQNTKPNYKLIYSDILKRKSYEKKFEKLCGKDNFSTLEVLELNRVIFGSSDKETKSINQKLHAYSEEDIIHILEYQRRHKLTNSELSVHFKLSRNTIAKWKKLVVDFSI